MPVLKFRSIYALKAATERRRRSQPVDWRAVAQLLAMADAGSPRRLVPGVYKHRTVADWNAQTDAWEQEAVERAKARVTGPAPNRSDTATT